MRYKRIRKPKFEGGVLYLEKIDNYHPCKYQELYGYEHPYLIGVEHKGDIDIENISFLGQEGLFMEAVSEAYKQCYQKDLWALSKN